MKSLPGKTTYIKTFNLQIGLSTGTMTDFINWKCCPVDLEVRLTINDKDLYHGSINANGSEFSFLINDSDIETLQEFKIELVRVPDNKNNTSPMLKIDYVWIENLCMRKTFEDSGTCVFHQRPTEINIPSEFMGEPGAQTLKFSTPIYPWLLSNQKSPDYYYQK